MSFDCRRFDKVLEAFLDGTLPAAEARAAQDHLRACADCHELALIAGAPIDAAPDLTAQVLARTSGQPCEGAKDNLCDYVDGRAADVDAELIRMHIASCADCAALGDVLVELTADLPLLAEIQLDERFTADVLARTAAGRERSARWIEQLVQGWDRLIRRPRFALEGAYVLTILLLVFLGVPGALLAGAPGRVAETATREIASPVRQTVVELGVTFSERTRETLDTTGERVAVEAQATADDVAAYSVRMFEDLKIGMGTFWSRLASRQANDDENDSPDNGDGQDGDER